MLNDLPEAGPLRFVHSPEATRGGCIVQTRFGVIDARRETKLEQLQQDPERMTPRFHVQMNRLNNAIQRVREARVTETCGRVVQLIGLVVESEGPLAAMGEVCRIQSARHDG